MDMIRLFGNKVFLRVTVSVFFSLFCLSSFGKCEDKVREFYVEYMQNIGRNPELNEALCEAHITSELRVQLGNYIAATDVDPVLRAQDVCDYGIESLSVTDLSDDWYMVRYKWDSNSEYIEIPLKASEYDGTMKISYITPLWLGNRYGDILLRKE